MRTPSQSRQAPQKAFGLGNYSAAAGDEFNDTPLGPNCSAVRPSFAREHFTELERLRDGTLWRVEERATRGRPDANLSEKSTFGHADHCVRGDHQVIENPHVHQLQRGLQRLRQVLVGTARFRRAGRMVVRQDDRGGIELQ